MWQRFTKRARRAILLAQEAAMELNSAQVDTEHLLLGLVRDAGNGAQQVLQSAEVLATQIEHEPSEVAPHSSTVSTEPRLTPLVKRILELSADEARRMGTKHIGTEHMLLALLVEQEEESEAQRVLHRCNLDLTTARSHLQQLTICAGMLDDQASTRTGWIEAIGHSVTKQSADAAEVEKTLLRALLEDENGFAARTLVECGLDLEAARRKLEPLA